MCTYSSILKASLYDMFMSLFAKKYYVIYKLYIDKYVYICIYIYLYKVYIDK